MEHVVGRDRIARVQGPRGAKRLAGVGGSGGRVEHEPAKRVNIRALRLEAAGGVELSHRVGKTAPFHVHFGPGSRASGTPRAATHRVTQRPGGTRTPESPDPIRRARRPSCPAPVRRVRPRRRRYRRRHPSARRVPRRRPLAVRRRWPATRQPQHMRTMPERRWRITARPPRRVNTLHAGAAVEIERDERVRRGMFDAWTSSRPGSPPMKRAFSR